MSCTAFPPESSPFIMGAMSTGGIIMSIPNDPAILLSYINTKLRDDFPDLGDLCSSLCISREYIEKRLAAIGYTYDPQKNCFR